MNIAYLLNTFPMTSSTFIRGEIEALENQGVDVRLYAVRRWSEALVDPRDVANQARTRYLLTGNTAGLLKAFLRQALTRPLSLVTVAGLWLRLVLNARGRFVAHAAYLLQAVSFLQQTQADGIAHVHVHFSTNAAAVAMLSRRMGGPTYSFTAHGPDEFLDAQQASLGLKMTNAAFVVAISHYCRETLLRLGGRHDGDKIHIARCGLDLDAFERNPPPAAASDDIVCIGRLCPQKGQTLLPGIAAALRDEFPRMRLVLIGDGESRGAIEAEIEQHGVEDRVRLLGWRDGREVRSALAAARGLILPSYAEGLPIVILEALALQRPVISTTIAGIPEIVDPGCGWIVPPGSTGELTAAVRSLMEADEATLIRLGQEGRARVERMHDVARLASTLRGLFGTTMADAATGQKMIRPATTS